MTNEMPIWQYKSLAMFPSMFDAFCNTEHLEDSQVLAGGSRGITKEDL